MTADSAMEVQTALYAELAAALNVSVYDHVPAGAAFPYVVIGGMASRPFDTQGFEGNDITAEIHAYSRAPGFREVQGLLAEIRTALHEGVFDVEGQDLVMCRHLSADVAALGDGETRRGTTRFRVVTEPAA